MKDSGTKQVASQIDRQGAQAVEDHQQKRADHQQADVPRRGRFIEKAVDPKAAHIDKKRKDHSQKEQKRSHGSAAALSCGHFQYDRLPFRMVLLKF